MTVLVWVLGGGAFFLVWSHPPPIFLHGWDGLVVEM